MINAHQHLTGDPLVRSCIPDLLAPGASIFEWSVPLHGAHTGDDDEMSATLRRPGVGAERRHDRRRGRDRGAPRPGRRRARGRRAARHDRHLGLGRRGRAVHGADRRGARPPAGGGRAVAGRRARSTGWVTLVGHDLASDELLAGAADLARCGRHRHDDAPVADVVGPGAATWPGPGGARSSTSSTSACSVRTSCSPTACGSTTTRSTSCSRRGTAIAYCPWAYLRLGQGVTRSRSPRRARRTGRAGRPRLRRLQRRRRGRHPARRRRWPPASPATPASTPSASVRTPAFELATIAGAEAIGMADRIGSLEPGKQADLVVHRADGWGWSPRGDVGLQLVWGTRRSIGARRARRRPGR